jgi:hypothetical protein
MAKTTLILGAGASANYGFPLGSGLRAEILQLQGNSIAQQMGVDERSLDEFVTEFRESQQYSIDSFLARRPTAFETIGKKAIARTLLYKEHSDRLMDPKPEDHWYQFLVNNIYNTLTIDDLDLSWLSIVTFNYDRSLELYLLRTLSSTYGVPIDIAREKVKSLCVVHVYGDLGSLSEKDGNEYVPYNFNQTGNVDFIGRASERIRVIHDSREDSLRLDEIKAIIAASNNVAFLGFAFDTLNVQRLGFPGLLSENTWVGGTIQGIPQSRKEAISLQLGLPSVVRMDANSVHSWMNSNCVDFLTTRGMLSWH